MISKITKLLSIVVFSSVVFFVPTAKAEILGNGVTLGLGGHYVMTAQNDYSDEYVLEKERALGGYVSLGYLICNGFEIGLEGGYRVVKVKDAENLGLSIKITNVVGLIMGSYYLDTNFNVYPYVKVGAGINRMGVDVKVPHIFNPILSKKNVTAFKTGIGVATVFESVVVGIGYEFFGTLKANLFESKDKDGFDFKMQPRGSSDSDFVSERNHSIEAFIKFIIN